MTIEGNGSQKTMTSCISTCTRKWTCRGHYRGYFYIVSDMHSKVLDVSGSSPMPGTKVIVWPKKCDRQARNQLWYCDVNGIIRSAMNDFALTAPS